MSQVIPVAEGGQRALEYLMRILATRFNADMAEVLAVVPDANGKPYTPDGILMLPVSRWYRQAAPTRTQLEDPPHDVCGYVGPVGATQYPTPFKSLTGWGAIGDVILPFGATVMLREAAQKSVTDPAQPPHKLTPPELLLMRCLRYQGALKHTLTKWGCFDVSCRDIDPTEDIAVGGDIGAYTEDQANTLRGVIYVEFSIRQEQGFPLQAKLPTP